VFGHTGMAHKIDEYIFNEQYDEEFAKWSRWPMNIEDA
jgi:hypothetical protein